MAIRFPGGLCSPILAILISGCTTLLAPYDPAFDAGLNKLSEDTAKFIAAAEAGSAERSYLSKESVSYYAASYNVMDRLIERAKPDRGRVACSTNEALPAIVKESGIDTSLPDDYQNLDCREFQLHAVRIYLYLLERAHQSGGTLNYSEAKYRGEILGVAILGAIQTFLGNKPDK